MVEHGVACFTDARVRGTTTGVRREHSLHGGQNKRVVCYVSVSLVLLPAMHNECPRHALSIEFEYKLTRVSLTWLPRLGPNSVCVKATMPLFLLQARIKATKATKRKAQIFSCVAPFKGESPNSPSTVENTSRLKSLD